MTTRINADRTVAVAEDYEWQPMTSCPIGVKVQLIGKGRVAVYGQWDGKEQFWLGWAPAPKIPDWMKT